VFAGSSGAEDTVEREGRKMLAGIGNGWFFG
jgi:hypothetical protein